MFNQLSIDGTFFHLSVSHLFVVIFSPPPLPPPPSSLTFSLTTDKETLCVFWHVKLFTCVSEVVGVFFMSHFTSLLSCGDCTIITNRKWKRGVCITRKQPWGILSVVTDTQLCALCTVCLAAASHSAVKKNYISV